MFITRLIERSIIWTLMKKVGWFIVFFVLLTAAVLYLSLHKNLPTEVENSLLRVTTRNSTTNTSGSSVTTQPSDANAPVTTVIADHLDTPWAIAFLPDKSMLVTERPGRLRLIDSSGKLEAQPVATFSQVKEIGEGGLLGIALHPQFTTNHYIYLYYTYTSNGANTLNRVVRMTYADKKVSDEKVMAAGIQGSSNHDGGRIKFGPDGYLYVTVGDAENPSQAQSTSTLGGKVLRMTDEGKPAPGNPFNNLVYSYGHRNPQGLVWDAAGNLWETEHGRSGISTGLDEINLIQPGKNYGWPTIQGDVTKAGMETPKKNSGPYTTWAPSGAVFIGNSLYFGGLKGQSLYEAVISGTNVTDFKEHLKGEFGRLRDVVLGPDGMLYVTTSNQDGRGSPVDSDDRVIRVNPQKL